MPVDWNQRYFQQSRWTKPLRDYLLKDTSIQPTSRVLEVGCGTGVICADFLLNLPCQLYGLDINYSRLITATRKTENVEFINGDALAIPFPDDTFELVYCHYFLLWVTNPEQALLEIKRILIRGGTLLIFAEPDHQSRIDAPNQFESIGKLQTESLKTQGADVSIGRKLPGLLSQSGFSKVTYGVSGFQIQTGGKPDWWDSEWEILFDDLKDVMDINDLRKIQKQDRSSWEMGTRVLWIPTFYARCLKS